MTLLMLEGFDDYDNLATWPRAVHGSGCKVLVDALARTGGGYMQFGAGGSNEAKISLAVGDEHALLAVGFAYRSAWDTSELDILSLRSDGVATEHVVLRRTLSGDLAVDRGSTQLAVTTAGNLWTKNVWHYLEIEALLSDTVGTVKVWLNGSLVINLAGVDTKNGGTKTVFDGIWIQGLRTNYWDDLYISNGAGSLNVGRIGEIRVETKYMDGNGNYSQLVGSDGNSVDNYLQVDEQGAPSSTDYNGSATDGQKDTYATEDLSVATATIPGVEVRMYAAKTDAGAKSIRRVHRRGAVDSVGADRVLATSYDTYYEILEQDPNGPAAWTVANFNASEFGAEVRP